MNITARIDKLRRERAWSVARLARETNIPTVSLRVMLGRNNVNNYGILALQKISKALDTSVSYLTKENDEDIVPQLTNLQKKELQELINRSIESFFSKNQK